MQHVEQEQEQVQEGPGAGDTPAGGEEGQGQVKHLEEPVLGVQEDWQASQGQATLAGRVTYLQLVSGICTAGVWCLYSWCLVSVQLLSGVCTSGVWCLYTR